MDSRLKQFLDESFQPYGNFPARKDVEQELLVNLIERYNDLKAEGKTDEEAYRLTTESFGDASEIMEQVAPSATVHNRNNDKQSIGKSIAYGVKNVLTDSVKGFLKDGDSRFRSTSLIDADLSGSQLNGADFSMSALMGANFDKSDLRESKFKATALKKASFVGADLTKANFDGSDLTSVRFDEANLTEAKLNRCALKGSLFSNANLNYTEFKQADLTDVSFEGQTLTGTIFDSSSLKNTSFKNTILINVSFHHSEVKKTIFDGATMDNITYALLKGVKANLDNVVTKRASESISGVR